MANVHPDRTFSAGGTVNVTGAGTIHEALNSSTSSYVGMNGATFSVGLATPSGLGDDLRWVRGELLVGSRLASPHTVAPTVALPQQPSFALLPHPIQFGNFNDTVYAQPGTSRYITGPRSLFLGGQWAFTQAINPGSDEECELNNFRFEIHDYIDAPVAAIVGPLGAITVTDAGLPCQWTFTSPHGFAYAGWRLQICTQSDGSGIIYTAAGSSGTTHTVPAFVLAPWLGTQLYLRVSVAHDVAGGYLGPDPATGTTQFGAFVQGQFTPTGVITVSFGAARPSGWVDDLDDADRLAVTLSHEPIVAAVLYQWDGARSWPLELVSGSVTLDAGRQIRGTCELTVANAELRPDGAYPIDPDRPLHPYGSYVQLARGVNGKLVALGAFVIERVESDVTVSGSSVVNISGSDFARFVADARLTYNKVRQTWNGAGYVPSLATAVMTEVVNEAGLVAVIDGSDASSVAPSYLNKRTDDRPKILDDVSDSIGWEWWADSHGEIHFGPAPTVTATPRYELVEGEDCTVVRHSITLSRADTFDLSVAYDDAGIWVAGAYDANPDSPIRRGDGDPDTPTVGAGPFAPGGKPWFFASPIIANLAGGEATARTNLTRKAVPAERITLELVPKPDLRPGHVVSLQRTGAPVRGFIVESVNTPLVVTDRQVVTAYAPVTWIVAVAS